MGKLQMHVSTIVQGCLPRKDLKTDLVQKQWHILFTSKAKRLTSGLADIAGGIASYYLL